MTASVRSDGLRPTFDPVVSPTSTRHMLNNNNNIGVSVNNLLCLYPCRLFIDMWLNLYQERKWK